MKKLLITTLYFIVFWIILPAGLIWSAEWVDGKFFLYKSLPRFLAVTGWIILLPAGVWMIRAVMEFRNFSGRFPVSAMPPANLIEKGMFAKWRHPIYLFAALMILGLALIRRSYGFAFVVFPLFLAMMYLYIRIEEHFLEKRFGAAYTLYKQRVPLVIPRFIELIRPVVALFFRYWFRIKIFNRGNIPASPPYFVIASHRNYLDPFILSIAIPHMIRHICTYEMFRGGINKILFNWMGAIPKKRFKVDYKSNKMINKALNDGYAIGVFPEGERGWTGEMQSLKPESLRLFRHFPQVPILPTILEGNYHSWPRWSNRLLRAGASVTFGEPFFIKPGMNPEDLASMITEKITPRPHREAIFTCSSKNRITNLPMVIYRCPYCRGLEKLTVVPPDTLICSACKNKLILNPDFRVTHFSRSEAITNSIGEIYAMIRIKETDLISFAYKMDVFSEEIGPDAAERIIYYAQGSVYRENGTTFYRVANGEITLTNHDLSVYSDKYMKLLDLKDLDAVTIESNRKLQLYIGKTDELYQICFESSSVLMWQDFIVLINQRAFGKNMIMR